MTDTTFETARAAPHETPAPAKAWLVILALAVGSFAIGTTEFAAMSLLPYFAVGLSIDEATASHVISAYALGVVIGAPVIAALAAHLPRRTLAVGLMVAIASANLLSAFAPSYGWMLAFRFLSGFPHGAYFGVAALRAASLAPPEKRPQAIGRVMLGLTIATIVGVPMASWLGQWMGWRWGFGVTGGLASLAAVLIAAYAPRDGGDPDATPLRELGALANRQVWLTLAIGAIGFGGMFAVYSYTASTLLSITRLDEAFVPAILAIFGVGLTLGTLFSSWAADKSQFRTLCGMLIASMAALASFPLAASHAWSMAVVVFLVGFTGSLGTVLQTRLMDVARDAQTLAAALNHSAFNAANALGPWLVSIALVNGYGFLAAGPIGATLSCLGLLICLLAFWDARRSAA